MLYTKNLFKCNCMVGLKLKERKQMYRVNVNFFKAGVPILMS